MNRPTVVAFGGGHGLAASLSALRHLTDAITAIVTVADDGGSSGRLRAEYERSHGLDPGPALEQALASLGRVAELWPDPPAFNDLGNAHVTRALVLARSGGDPRRDLDQAVECYRKALATAPDFGYAHANLGLALVDRARARFARGLDPEA